jgi:hypothetical protein
MMIDEQIATAVDCEGYIGIYRSRDKRRNRYGFSPRVSLGMTHPAIPNELKRRFGSNIYLHKSRSEYRQCYSWVIQNKEEVKAFLEIILPHLLVKYEQAKNVLEFIAYCNSHPACWQGNAVKKTTDNAVLESYWLKAKELNQCEPATTKREDLVIGCDSLNSQETVREESEEVLPA